MRRVGIVITGYPGSGSTSLCQNLASEFGQPRHYYAGGAIRWLTRLIEDEGESAVLERISIKDIRRAIETGDIPLQPNISQAYRDFPPELDKRLDEAQEELLWEKDFGVHEGRIAPYLVRRLRREERALDKVFFKILCTVEERVGAKRQGHRQENQGKSVEQIVQETRDRLRWERERYRRLYGIEDHLDLPHFDLIVNTTLLSEAETCLAALTGIEERHPGLLAPHLKEK